METTVGTIAVAVAAKISEKVVDLCCFNNIVADFEKERQDLLASQLSVQDHVKQAINQNEVISEHVKHWEEKARELALEDTKTKKTCFFGWFPDCIWRYHRGKDLKEKTREINKIIAESKDYIKFSLTLPDVEYYPTEVFVEFQSRKPASKQLLDALKDGDHYVIGLWGIGGTGKTTLAIQVGMKVQKSRLFDHVIKVRVSSTPKIKNIQHEIASLLGLNLEGEHELDGAKRLWKKLTSGEKILIILDEVWEKLNFDEIGIPSSNDRSNCRVLLTTRDIKVCKSMGCSTMIELELLSEEDAWILFRECAGLDEVSPKTLKDKGQKIAKECKGLPVAITIIASTLRGEEEKEWDIALRSLRSVAHNDEVLIKIYKCLKLSYDLKDKKAQHLFLLCSVFPEDYEILVEDLAVYATALGLCGEVTSFEEARDHLHRAKKKLIDSCLLLKANKEGECVKMHRFLHGLAHWMQNGKIKVIMEDGSNQNTVEKTSSLRYLYCHVMNDFLDLLDCPELEILILEFDHKMPVINIPDTFFEGVKDLKVCTLGADDRRKMPSFPKSFEVLKSLRTLTLRSLVLGDISILGKLQMLKSVRLEACIIDEVPSAIVQLKKLKLLSLKNCAIEKNSYEVMEQIVPQLEELYFLLDDNLYGKVDDNSVITKFLNKCMALKRYQIELAEQGELRRSLNGPTSRALSIAYFDPSTSDATVKDLMKRAEILHLHKIEGGYETIIPDFVQAIGGLNKLIEIELKSCSEIEFLIDTTKSCFSVATDFFELEKIDLIGMDHLKALCQGPPPSGFLENLREMKIEKGFQGFTLSMGNLKLRRLKVLDVSDCHKLTSLFTLPTAQSLVLLESLIIYGCRALKSIIADDSEKKEIMTNDHDQLRLFPKLKCLDIMGCAQFEGLMSVGSNERQSLEVTTSSESRVIMRYMELEQLKITTSQIEGNFGDEGLEVYLKLENLSEMSYIYEGPNMWSSPENLTSLSVKGCGKLKVIICTSIVRSFPQLKELIIANCEAVEQIVEEGEENQNITNPFFPELKRFWVKNCSKLKCLLYMNTLGEFPKLEELIIMEASNLEQVFGGSDHSKREKAMQNNVLPNLEQVILVELPSLTNVWPCKLRTVKNLVALDCPKLSLTSTMEVKEHLRRQLIKLEIIRAARNASHGDADVDVHEYMLRRSILQIIVFNLELEAERTWFSEWKWFSSQSNTQQSMPHNIAKSSHELDEDNNEETTGQSVQEIANPLPGPFIIPVHKESTLELLEKESSNETITINQMEIEKAKSDIHSDDSQNRIKGSVQAGSMSQNAKIVASSERLTPELAASLCGTSSQGFVGKGSREPISKGVIEQDRSTNEVGERLEKPSDVPEKTLLQADPQMAILTGNDLKNDSWDQNNDKEEEEAPAEWKRTTITAVRSPQNLEKDTSNEHSKQNSRNLQNIEMNVAETAEATAMTEEQGIYEELDHLESIISGASYESATTSVDTLAKQSERKEDFKAALNCLEELFEKDVDEVYNNDVEISKLVSALSLLETANEFDVTVGIKSFLLQFKESYLQLFCRYTLAKSIESKFKALENEKEQISTFSKLARSQRKQLKEKIKTAEAELQSPTVKILEMNKALADLGNQDQSATYKVTAAKSEEDELKQRSMEMIARATEVMSQLNEAKPTYEEASYSLIELRNSWNNFRLTFQCNISRKSRD